MNHFESFDLDNSDNTLVFAPADIDGFQIKEIVGKGQVYIYYSEIDNMINSLLFIRNKLDYKKNSFSSINVLSQTRTVNELDQAYKCLKSQLETLDKIKRDWNDRF